MVPAFADDFVMVNNNTSNQRIGVGFSQTLLSQLQAALHENFVRML
jgi:hypothetical protein